MNPASSCAIASKIDLPERARSPMGRSPTPRVLHQGIEQPRDPGNVRIVLHSVSDPSSIGVVDGCRTRGVDQLPQAERGHRRAREGHDDPGQQRHERILLSDSGACLAGCDMPTMTGRDPRCALYERANVLSERAGDGRTGSAERGRMRQKTQPRRNCCAARVGSRSCSAPHPAALGLTERGALVATPRRASARRRGARIREAHAARFPSGSRPMATVGGLDAADTRAEPSGNAP